MSPDIELDLNGDGKVTAEEAQLASKLEKDSTMLSQSWLAVIAMCGYPFCRCCPSTPIGCKRLRASATFFISPWQV